MNTPNQEPKVELSLVPETSLSAEDLENTRLIESIEKRIGEITKKRLELGELIDKLTVAITNNPEDTVSNGELLSAKKEFDELLKEKNEIRLHKKILEDKLNRRPLTDPYKDDPYAQENRRNASGVN